MSKRNKQRSKNAAEVFPLAQKQQWFSLYGNQKKLQPDQTIKAFLESIQGSAPKLPSQATMGRIVQTGLTEKWPGWEDINGRCERHPNVLLKEGDCEACAAEEVLRARSPKSLAESAKELAARVYPTLSPNEPLKRFIESDAPVQTYVEFFAPRNPDQVSPQVYVYDGHDEADD